VGISASNCEACAKGQYQPETGKTFCLRCLTGKYGTSDATCTDCPPNQYQDARGQQTCKTCTVKGEEPNAKHTACAKPSWTTAADCGDAQYLNDTSSNKNDWACFPCPVGASCLGDIAWSDVLPKFGWSRCHNNDVAFERCTFPAACLGGKNPALVGKYLENTIDLADCHNGNCTAKCNIAYVNASLMCGQCAYNYSHDGLSGRCDRCPPLNTNIGVAIGGGLLGLLGIFVYIQITLSDAGHLDESDGAKSIGLSFIQLISLLVTFPIAW
jgi:hypothetical protein